MEYITTKEAAAKWGISTSRITLLANEGRIPGAQRLGKSWLIPAIATKPPAQKADHSRKDGTTREKTDEFFFPLFHFRPDWSSSKEAQLSEQGKKLLLVETAVLECRFTDAYPLLAPILEHPEDISTEVAGLWNAGICCLALNKPMDFSKVYLRLQMLFSEDFPHRDDLSIILEVLNTYIQTMDSAANSDIHCLDLHEQCLPLICSQIGYAQLSKETLKLGLADTALLELNLRLLKTTGVVIAVQLMHCYLLGIYYLRQNMVEAQKHGKAIVQIAYENKFYFPLVSYYSYFAPVLDPIIAQYPEDFQKHCHTIISLFEKNYTDFLSSLSQYEAISKITAEERPYILGVLTGLTNTAIAEKMGVSQQTVKRKLTKVCEKLGVETRKELLEYLHNYM